MIRGIVQRRGIQNLYHFTRIKNLPGILKYGLIPRAKLENYDIEHEINDQDRYDNCEDGNCLSLSFPNYKMFYKLMNDLPNVEWIILQVTASVLWEKDCAFCIENAASNNVTCIPVENRKGPAALERLFEDVPNKKSRAEIGTPSNFPTNPQAEVLVFDVIEPSYIPEIFFRNLASNSLSDFQRKFPNHNISAKSALFSYRFDWAYW